MEARQHSRDMADGSHVRRALARIKEARFLAVQGLFCQINGRSPPVTCIGQIALQLRSFPGPLLTVFRRQRSVLQWHAGKRGDPPYRLRAAAAADALY